MKSIDVGLTAKQVFIKLTGLLNVNSTLID